MDEVSEASIKRLTAATDAQMRPNKREVTALAGGRLVTDVCCISKDAGGNS